MTGASLGTKQRQRARDGAWQARARCLWAHAEKRFNLRRTLVQLHGC